MNRALSLWKALLMSARIALAVLGTAFLAAFLISIFLLSIHPTPDDGLYCDSAAEIVLYGQGGYGDQFPNSTQARECEELARVPGIAGFAIAAAGLGLGTAWILLFRRITRGRAYGEPISRARRAREQR